MNSSFAFWNFLEFLFQIFLIPSWLKTQLQSPRILRGKYKYFYNFNCEEMFLYSSLMNLVKRNIRVFSPRILNALLLDNNDSNPNNN